jgi:acetyltransferase-like isoleucine patch superfamily enzyme
MIAIVRLLRRGYIFLFHGRVYQWVIRSFSLFAPIYQTRNNESPVGFRQWLNFKTHPSRNKPYWPIHPTSMVRGSWKNVYVGIDAAPGISPGCYILAIGKIYIDDYAQVAPNVGILSGNHFMLDIRKDIYGEVRIGKYCRIGMGSIIHPGVTLGDFTTVAAGAVVTRSFPDGYCVIAGNPAAVVTDYSRTESIKQKFLRYRNEFEYNGFIPHAEFESFRKKYLTV